MKNLELSQMEQLSGGGCGGWGWAGFGAVALVGAGIIVAVATGGAALPFLLTTAGMYGSATVTAAGVTAIYADCD